MKNIFTLLIAMMIIGSASASESKIVVSINPIHSLVSSVMEGIEMPALLIKGADSLHGYQVKPSDASLLDNAEVIVWLGPTIESTLNPSISNLQEDRTVIEVGEMHGLKLYENRESPGGEHGHGDEDHHGMEEEHGHDEEEHHGEEEHGHMDEDHHDEEKHAQAEDHHNEEEHGHMDEHGHEHGRLDLHVWLDIDNAKVITEEMAEHLAEVLPQHEAQMTANVNKTLERLDALEAELRSLSKSFSSSPYVVFHDAYQYLEKMLGLNNVGTVTVNPELTPGAKTLLELRETIGETGATCAFKEPQFSPKALEVIAEGTDLKIGILDPLGADIEPGPNAYFELLRNMVHSLKDCLG